jgi:RNA polymerase sigma-70 factor (ECF subfamily)
VSSDPSFVRQSAARDCFVTTRWTVILHAGRRSTPQADEALEELCQTYWFPLYAFLRRKGESKEDAEDLVQGFFARLLDRNYLEGVASERGKFRAFLLASFKHYLANERDRAGRQKRGGNVPHLSLDWQAAHTRYNIEPVDQLSPDKLYDRAWAVTVLERVITRLQAESTAEGKSALFAQIKPFLMLGRGATPYAQAADKLKLTESALRVAVHRLRRRYREMLREEVAQTLAEPSQTEEEMRALIEALAS